MSFYNEGMHVWITECLSKILKKISKLTLDHWMQILLRLFYYNPPWL